MIAGRSFFQRRYLHFWTGVAISVLFSFFALQGVKWGEFGASFRAVVLPFVLLSAVSTLAGFVVLALRWRILLRPAGAFPFRDCLSFLMIGNLANFILPLRAGELIRPALFGQRTGASKSSVFATVVVERLLDLFSLAVLVAILALAMQMPAVVRDGALAAEAGAAIFLGSLWLASRRQVGGGIVMHISRIVPVRGRAKVITLLESFLAGLGALQSGRQLWAVGVYSLLGWIVAIVGIELMLLSFGLSLPWYAPVFVVLVSNLGMAIPSSPGFIGVAHFLYIFSLSVFDVDKSVALSFAIMQHGVSYLLTVAVGLFFLWREGIALAHLTAAGRELSAG